MNKPNIVFFMLDQFSAKWLKAGLAGACPLPNIQKLMDRGVSFKNAITSNPVCCPARATLATGLTSRGHGVLENGYELDPKLPTFMQALQKAGYRTGAFGKVHLQPHFKGFYPDYHQYGFGVTHITEDGRGGQWLDWVETEHPEWFEQVLLDVWATGIPELEHYGKDRRNLKEVVEKAKSKHAYTTEQYPQNNPKEHTYTYPKELSQTEWITRHAERFIGDMPEEAPFMAHISYVQPHGPYIAPEEYMAQVDVEKIPAALLPAWQDDPDAPVSFQRRFGPYDSRHARHCYFADMVHLDEQLGRVVHGLNEKKVLDNTVLILLSDHGDLMYDHGFFGKEERHYDACIRVPLIIAGPGIEKGLTSDAFVQLEDICPTVLECTGASMPPMPHVGNYLKCAPSDIPVLPGRSLVPLLKGEKCDSWRASAYVESYNTLWSMDPRDWARTIRDARYRYTWYPLGGGEQLFDLENDPDEQHNLSRSENHATVKAALKGQLMEKIVLQDYPKTRRNLFSCGVH